MSLSKQLNNQPLTPQQIQQIKRWQKANATKIMALGYDENGELFTITYKNQ